MSSDPHHPHFSPADDAGLRPLIVTAEHVVEEARPHPIPPAISDRIHQWWPLLLALGITTLVLISPLREQLGLTALLSHYDEMVQWIRAHPYLSGSVYVVFMSIVFATGFLGCVVFEVVAGALFGALLGFALSMVGIFFGSAVLFNLGRRAVGAQSEAHAPAIVATIREHFQSNPVSYAYFMRLVPIFPFGGVTLALAWLRCPTRLFYAATIVGTIPSALVYAWLGQGLQSTLNAHQPFSADLMTEPRVLLPLLGLAVLSALPPAWRAISHWLERNKSSET